MNSGTHEQINQPVSRQDAKAQRGRERRGNLAGKQEIAGKQEECRFNHRGSPRGTEGERKRGRGEGDNIQYSKRNFQCSRGNAERLALQFLLYYPLTQHGLWQWLNEKRVLKTRFGGIVVQRCAEGGGFNIGAKGHQIPMVKLLPKWFWIPPSETSFFR